MGAGGSTAHGERRGSKMVKVSPRDANVPHHNPPAIPSFSTPIKDNQKEGRVSAEFSSLEKEAPVSQSPDNNIETKKVLQYGVPEKKDLPNQQEKQLDLQSLTHEFWTNARQDYWEKARQREKERSPESPRSELSSLGSSDSGDEFCFSGRRESIYCGTVMVREQPHPFSKHFTFVEHEVKVKRTKLYLIPTQKSKKHRPVQVFKLSNIDKVDVKRKDSGYATICLTLSQHLCSKPVTIGVDTSKSDEALEWVEGLSKAVQLEQIRALQVKNEFRNMLQKQNEAWRRPSLQNLEL